MEGSPAARSTGIDATRAVAALAVLASHLAQTLTWRRPGWEAAAGAAARPVHALTGTLGAWGVGLFLVVSGLCIHLPVARQLAADAGARLALAPYLRRRFTRIYPPYLAALALSGAVAWALPDALRRSTLLSVPTPSQLASHLLLVHTALPGHQDAVSGVFWTIALEAHLYLLYPLLLVARRRVGIAWTCAALLTLAVAARVVAKATLSADLAEVVDVSVLRRGWEFGLGMWVAERLAREGRPWRGARVAWLGLGGVTLAAGLGLAFLPGGLRVRAFAWPLLFAVAVEWAARAGGPASLLERLARWVGERSYSLYLVHPVGLALGMWVYAGWQDGRAAGAAVMLCCTGLLFVGGGAPVRGPGATGASSARARQPGGVKRSPRPVLRRGMHAPRQPDGQGPGEWASPTARQRPGSAGRPGAL